MKAFVDMARALDERVNLKRVHRSLAWLAKVLIVLTFMEDALRVPFTFEYQQESMQTASWQTPVLHSALPILSFCVQLGASLLVVLSASTVAGCYILLAWCLFHPFMYSQLTNGEFMLETLTIMGGLLILLSHEQLNAHASASALLLPGGAKPSESLKARANRLQMVGRVLITSIFLYYAFFKVRGYAQRLPVGGESHDAGAPLVEALLSYAKRVNISGQTHDAGAWSLVEALLIVLLLCLSSLVIIGMKSRWCALLLAVVMAGSAFYMHPFWVYYFSRETYTMHVPGMEGYEVEAFTMADHQRYFFFQRMSTVGALLLLVVHGPGNLSVETMEQQGTTETILKSIASNKD